ncbi:MAG: glutamate synthase large subunit [Pseudoflavonifractor sp.]|nr:glutamate synthase large subunit [Alloprevotella sp.]MCM1116204.1 glutamate synthase large subunit [Pseudoflavonifractor sp.]
MKQPLNHKGLYRSDAEHDACGVGLLVNINGVKNHQLVENALLVLEHMTHRGAEGADPGTGDGAGIMVQIPHEFILLQGIPVPERGRYGTGLIFFPRNIESRRLIEDIIATETAKAGLSLLPLRPLPVDNSMLGPVARSAEPDIAQLFVADEETTLPMEPRLYLLRRAIEKAVAASQIDGREEFYIVSLSSHTIVYKGMLSSMQLRHYFPDLTNPRFTSAMALVHSRFSTNTFPTWALAQPFRLLGHNGEINTIRGNRLWMKARECVLRPEAFGDADLTPIIQPDMSDSASLDNVLEYFVMAGMSLPHALAMLVPESFNHKNPISPELKAFYEYHSILMEPWDGPAALLFSDGRYAGGMLDRNGLRPARYLITEGGTMVIASEAGVLPFLPSEIKERGRLKPGKIILVDIEKGTIHYDPEIKEALASEHPYRSWLESRRVKLDRISSGRKVADSVPCHDRLLRAYGYTAEDLSRVIIPMATAAKEPVASMGCDIPLAPFSSRPQGLFSYFRQHFAQVTNPPIDPLRESLVMDLDSYIGDIGTDFFHFSPEMCKMVELNRPILSNRELDILCNLRYKGFVTHKLPMTFERALGPEGLRRAIARLCRMAEDAVDEGCNYIILSDRDVDAANAPIPSLLATSAVHHHLISRKKRIQTALIVETAEAREVMHFALLCGYGASAVNPYLAFAVIERLTADGSMRLDPATARSNYIKAIDNGLLKVISKMGISTLTGYQGACLFEAIGLGEELVSDYFGSTVSKIGGLSLDDLCRDILLLHAEGFGYETGEDVPLPNFGQYAYRRGGDPHAWNPADIRLLQKAVREGDYDTFREFLAAVDLKEQPIFIRDFLDYSYASEPLPLDEVESEEEIMHRFVTGAMSFGSISREAHEAIAIAMNSIGGRSNTGEGGELAERFAPRPDGSSARSAIKQIASGRFGVTAEYLVNADEIQIKVAQGAKPGEGGQLPGFKVDKIIARTRHSIPGISLISPPPHHDIYSIEDLAQLIFDLNNVNPSALISVKLVSESGVGTIAAGVAKAKADLITISGSEGGTGASPAGSIRYAGLPLEIGLAETQQTLVINNLRGQVKLQADGQLKSARDVIITAMLGAEEFGFSTAVLVALGCMMVRKCHLNTCPMGVATQNPELRRKFAGRPEHVANYFRFLARAIREEMAAMGIRSLDEIVGRADLLHPRQGVESPRTSGLDFSRLLHVEPNPQGSIRHTITMIHDTAAVLDRQIIARARQAIERAVPIELEYDVANTDRALGAMLSGEIARRNGGAGLPDDTIDVTFRGSAGQSFGAFLPRGVTFRLEGEANDYVGKGLSGGRICIVPPDGATFAPELNIIAGNTILYGATSGELYVNGRVGERFCVRNSGAAAVVEGVGDHCCEYMTGGRCVILGPTGRNFAAGMSGGVAYVWNPLGDFDYFCNMEMVELSLIEDASDNRELKRLVANHLKYTRSPLAARLLDDWGHSVQQFIKVIPFEYNKVLLEEKMAALRDKIEGAGLTTM